MPIWKNQEAVGGSIVWYNLYPVGYHISHMKNMYEKKILVENESGSYEDSGESVLRLIDYNMNDILEHKAKYKWDACGNK